MRLREEKGGKGEVEGIQFGVPIGIDWVSLEPELGEGGA